MNNVGTPYTDTMEAFRDLVYGMNHNLREKVYDFAEGHDCEYARSFYAMTKSITKRRLRVRRNTNQVEVEIL